MHDNTTISPVGEQRQFPCECGTTGPLRDIRGDAEADLAQHVEENRGQ